MPADDWGRLMWTKWTFRTLVTLAAVGAFLQPVFAGAFLSGHFGALDLHRLNAILATLVTLLATVSAVLMWLLGRGAGWPAATCAGIFVAEGAQIGLGFARVLSIHVFLGTAIVAAFVVLLLRVWRPVSAVTAG
jgi:hypothetical protein